MGNGINARTQTHTYTCVSMSLYVWVRANRHAFPRTVIRTHSDKHTQALIANTHAHARMHVLAHKNAHTLPLTSTKTHTQTLINAQLPVLSLTLPHHTRG